MRTKTITQEQAAWVAAPVRARDVERQTRRDRKGPTKTYAGKEPITFSARAVSALSAPRRADRQAVSPAA
jgi:hypothetical protein